MLSPRPLEPSLLACALHGDEDQQSVLIAGVGEAPGWPGMAIGVPSLLIT